MKKAAQINLDVDLRKMADNYSIILEKSDLDRDGVVVDFDYMDDLPGKYHKCIAMAPKKIQDLKDGVIIETYEFEKGEEQKLGVLGFINVELEEREKVTVVEFLQHGSVYCENQYLKYGVGCRLMMRIKSYKRGAKLNTPQQITASVIFDKAEVTFSLRTVGITGPAIANLNKAGTMSENTYTNFMTEVSKLIVEMYKEDSDIIVKPQPLFLLN